ncbi:RNA 2'-phosphotransferase [Pilimelia columellifera]|uniref:Probable RNA 2'-phosphotransferase n=1 Tax=Pilimelia columellifera subsp. columellifera TaxID=706583 RepID=A0ABN3NIZ7_9ACTN
MNDTTISKRLSYVLRHRPDSIGLTLTDDGWTTIGELLAAFAEHGTTVSRDQLARVVANNDKQRFTIDGERIRANQGHSIDVDLGLASVPPPDTLYHGTAIRHLRSILRDGLIRGRRQHVHLSADIDTALRVGARHGTPVVLRVDAAAMTTAGHAFYRSANGVWLTDAVPAAFLGHDA